MTQFRMKLPDLGEGVVEAEIVSWLVSAGEAVTPDTPIAEVMTDKSTVELTAPVQGTITELLVDEGDVVTVGTEIVVISRDGAAAENTKTPTATVAPFEDSAPGDADRAPATPLHALTRATSTTTEPPTGRRPRAAPTVRRRAQEMGIDLTTVPGTGPGGRILASDLEHAVTPPKPSHRFARPPRPADSHEPLRGLRRTIASRMATAWSEVPHITYVDEVDVEQIEAYRQALNVSFGDAGLRCTLLTFVARAVILACHDQPRINATFDTSEGVLHVHGGIHLGIATQTDAGLVVPVIRDADQMTLTELTSAIKNSTEVARNGNPGRDELTGSTITISSLGRLGGLVTTPIVNHPEVAVVGVNKIQIRPVWAGDSFVPRRVMNLSSSFDHRIVDGWDAATFVQRIKSLLETPAMVTLGWAR